MSILLTTCSFAQEDAVRNIPLPNDLINLPNKVTIYSTPNPNFPEYVDEERTEVAWKHSTIIKASESIEILETGAYLLRYGTWWKRASFSTKDTKDMFDTKTLSLAAGDSIVFEKNWRVEQWTRSGWNFWYVKALNAQGDTIMGYDILHTAGNLEDGTQIMPLVGPKSRVEWTGRAGDSDYALTGQISRMSGKMAYSDDVISDLTVVLEMESLTHEIADLEGHLKSKDFFHVSKYPEATFTAETLMPLENNQWEIEGELCLHGKCNQETWTATLAETDTSVCLSFEAQVNRTEYKVSYASSVKPDNNYSISDMIDLSGQFYFQKDYPGSNPWNSVEAKE